MSHTKDGEEEGPPKRHHPFAVPSKSAALDDMDNMSVVTSAGDTVHGAQSLSTTTTVGVGGVNDSIKDGTGSNKELLQRAVTSVLLTLGVSRQFRTLRDFNAVDIKKTDLRLIKRIGEGAFGLVEKCLYMPQNRAVAVKRLKPSVRKSRADIADMLKEIAVLRKLHNRNIIEFIGCGSWDTSSPSAAEETLFLVEEFVDGGTLKAVVSKQMKTSKNLYRMQDAVRWITEMAQGLKYLHQCQPMVIHRDLKLENILLSGTDYRTVTTKIADFGLSALVSPYFNHIATEEAKPPTSRRRRTSIVMAQAWTDNAMNRVTQEKLIAVAGQEDRLSGRTGTLMYMAPEVWLKQPYNDKADVYSFSIIAYELLHRYQMISATDGSLEECQVYARKVAQSGWRPPLDENLPPALKSLLAACWAPDPEHRPSMAEVVSKLLHIQKHIDWSRWDKPDPEELQQEQQQRGKSAIVTNGQNGHNVNAVALAGTAGPVASKQGPTSAEKDAHSATGQKGKGCSCVVQ